MGGGMPMMPGGGMPMMPGGGMPMMPGGGMGGGMFSFHFGIIRTRTKHAFILPLAFKAQNLRKLLWYTIQTDILENVFNYTNDICAIYVVFYLQKNHCNVNEKPIFDQKSNLR